jgi:hypothetical protein
MRTFTDNEPLTDAELDRLGDFLKSCKGTTQDFSSPKADLLKRIPVREPQQRDSFV